MSQESRKLNVFLSYASQDEIRARELYRRLLAEAWVSPWFDKEILLPGMNWEVEINQALRVADVILVLLSKESVAKEGYVQKEFKYALTYAEEKPDETIFLVPVRLDDCQVPFKFQQWQWLDYFSTNAYEKLIKSLKIRANNLKISISSMISQSRSEVASPSVNVKNPDLYTFLRISTPAFSDFFCISKYPVTNIQYARFLLADDFAAPEYWINFPKYDEKNKLIGNYGKASLRWLQYKFKDHKYFPPKMWKVEPKFWKDNKFGIQQPHNPVVGVSWYEANAYCKWLLAHWKELPEASSLLSEFHFDSRISFRLPLETEWVIAAGGDLPNGRYPWDLPGKITDDEENIYRCANIGSKIGHTTPVYSFSRGKSPHGVIDMAGNVWEWQANFYDVKEGLMSLCGGSWYDLIGSGIVGAHGGNRPYIRWDCYGFRVVAVTMPQ